MIAPGMTGGEIIVALEAEAVRRQVALRDVIGLITSVPAHWLPQMQRTGLPKRATIDRINALVFAESMPPTVRVDRDTCWRCGVRGDIGCAHRIAPWGVAA